MRPAICVVRRRRSPRAPWRPGVRVRAPSPPGETDSPAAVGIELLSRRWTRTVVEVLLDRGALRYCEPKDEQDGISDAALSDALEGLEEVRVVDREVVDDRPIRVRYPLTPVGASLETIVDDFAAWKREYLEFLEESGTADDPDRTGGA